MGFFKDIRNSFKEEFIESPKNTIDWDVFYSLKLYKFLVYYSGNRRPVQMTKNEVIEIYNKLHNEYQNIKRPNDEDSSAFNKIQNSGEWKLLYSTYPENYLELVCGLLSNAINRAYEDTQVNFDLI